MSVFFGVSLRKLNKAEMRFMKFLFEITPPLSEEKIIEFYKNNVQRYIEKFYWNYAEKTWLLKNYNEDEIRLLALRWFDMRMGLAIRKGTLSDYAKNKLNAILRTPKKIA